MNRGINEPVYKWLKRLREEKGLTQLGLAHDAELSSGHISRVEKGEKKVTSDYVIKVAMVLQLPVNDALLQAGIITPEAYALTIRYKGVIRNAKTAIEIDRLASTISDDTERENSLQAALAVVRVAAERTEERESKEATNDAHSRGKQARRARAG